MALTSFDSKIAFITGGAKGIGLGIARALIKRGAKVMLADINEEALAAAKAELGEAAETVICDVADSQSVSNAAEKTVERFGKVHLLFNNAGVGGGGRPGETSLEDWRWVVNINLLGVVYGVEAFVPLIKAHGEGGYIVNTASMAGLIANPYTGGPYNATKFAVVGYSETIHQQLAADNIGCSVLCPAWVATDIYKSAFAAPSLAGADHSKMREMAQFATMENVVKSGLSPDMVGDWVLDCMLEERLYILTHPEFEEALNERMNAIHGDYAATAADARFKSR